MGIWFFPFLLFANGVGKPSIQWVEDADKLCHGQMQSGGVRGCTFAKRGKHLVSQMGRGTIDSDRSLALPGLNQVDQINPAQGPIGAILGYLLQKDILANTPTRT